jgi:hypothetical protein
VEVGRDVLGRTALAAPVAPVLPVVPVARGVPAEAAEAAGSTTVGSVGPVDAVEAVADGFGGGVALAGFVVEGFVPGRWRRRLALLTWLPRCREGGRVVDVGVARRTMRVRAHGEGTVPTLNRAYGSLR